MSTYNPDPAVFDHETGCSPHWSRAESGSAPRSFVYPSQALPERRQMLPRPVGYQPEAVKQFHGNIPECLGLTPAQWLAQWCCLEEKA